MVFVLTCYFNFSVYGGQGDKDLKARAEKLHKEAIVIDAHAHPFFFGSNPSEWTPGTNSETSRIGFAKMRKGGVDAVLYALPFEYVRDPGKVEAGITASANQLKTVLAKYPETAVPVFTPEELERAAESGKPAVLLSLEQTHILGGDPAKITKYVGLGYRSVTLIHSKIDPIADTGKENQGLSDFGGKVIKGMNDSGMMMDITHLDDRMQSAVIEASRTPVMATHSCTRAVNDLRRNIPNDIIKKLAKKGGVIAVTFSPKYVSAEYYKKRTEADKKLKPIEEQLKETFKDNPEKQAEEIEKAQAQHLPPTAKLEELIDHIDHIVKLVGADYVGIGSDYIGELGLYPQGLEDYSGWPLITYHLLKRGYSESDIKKILGGNILRVFKEVQKAAVK
jgi:membrane dipeptidase